ncbi:cell wall-binding repeat-containing protein [Dehalobacter sp.]|uniref:cell wall-binding repeat-containing protein n=1 Tax=Dehalobacter sp. TaxID=1962289 RepID=UPI002584CA16|nr:cell wall-binding repeat-containing protein [Dehalobacter sp.]MCG1024851.1 cell wall-binding repeat-containing protein [Dehalobacter sp.]
MKSIIVKSITFFLYLFIFMLMSSHQSEAAQIQNGRLAGPDRYTTSVEIAKSGWNTSYYAILVSGENFPDAICAAPLASKYNAPILLTSMNKLNEPTKNELIKLAVKSVIIVGGKGVISADVEQEIKNLGLDVSRIAGIDRYETSLIIAKNLGNFNNAVIASGEDFPDILSIAPIAAKAGIPILLTSQNSLSTQLKDFLDNTVRKTYVLGDTNFVSDTVFKRLPSPERLSGSNQYETNINIINAFSDFLDLSSCYIATGENFPDALSGSVIASLTKSPVILVKEPLDQATSNFIQYNLPGIKKVTAFGGTGAVPDSLLHNIAFDNGSSNDALVAPTHVSATSVDSHKIYLAWDTISNATTYHIYRSTSSTGTFTKISSVTTPNYSDTYLSSGKTYYYKIQAENPSGLSAYSDIIQATTKSDNSTLGMPENVIATCVSTSEIDLTWDTVSNADSYNIYRTTADSGIYKIIASVRDSRYIDKSILSGVTYYYKVQAVNSSYTSAYSNVVYSTVFLEDNVLSAPANVVAIPLSSAEINIAWNPVSNSTNYIVYRSTSYDGTYANIASVTIPSYIDRNLPSGMTFYYKVQSVNSVGSSTNSKIVYAATEGNN